MAYPFFQQIEPGLYVAPKPSSVRTANLKRQVLRLSPPDESFGVNVMWNRFGTGSGNRGGRFSDMFTGSGRWKNTISGTNFRPAPFGSIGNEGMYAATNMDRADVDSFGLPSDGLQPHWVPNVKAAYPHLVDENAPLTPIVQPRIAGTTAAESNPFDDLEYDESVVDHSDPQFITGWRSFMPSFRAGYQYQHADRQDDMTSVFRGAGSGGRRSHSFFGDIVRNIHPDYTDRTPIERIAHLTGRFAGDVAGFGTQSLFWNAHPLDITSTKAYDYVRGKKMVGTDEHGKPVYEYDVPINPSRVGSWMASNMMGFGSGNWNPFNLAEGGRQAGFQAISADKEDPRKSDNPVLDMLLWRGVLGRTGRLLPWEQFHQERPNVPYETYRQYQEYLRDPGFLGLAKGTLTGVDGPEVRIMGYRVTPLGILAAGGTTVAYKQAMMNRPRIAGEE